LLSKCFDYFVEFALDFAFDSSGKNLKLSVTEMDEAIERIVRYYDSLFPLINDILLIWGVKCEMN